jgi:transcription elongation factor GreB
VSKAFLKDDGDSASDDDPESEIPAPTGSAYITAAGYRALQEELEHLWKVERPKVTNEVAVAAAQGDRSENAEYIYGKKRLREIDRRIRFLMKRLDALTVVEPATEQEGKVFFGAWVTVEHADVDGDGDSDHDGEGEREGEGKHTQHEYRIVGTDEIDLARGWISVESPIARALLGRSVGDSVTVRRPKGETELMVRLIRYR